MALLGAQPNFRDLGDRDTPFGRFRSGVLYRSGELSLLTDDDVATLQRLEIVTVIDLRSHEEVAVRGADRVPDGVDLVHIPITEADDVAGFIIERFQRGDFGRPSRDLLVDVNRNLVTEWRDAFITCVHAVVDSPGPTVIHCTHGKDRAGFAAALILDLLCVDRAEITANYMESNRFRVEENEAYLAAIRSAAEERSGQPAEALDLDWMRDLFYVDDRYIGAAFAELDERYGDAAGFLGGGDLRDRLAARLIDPT